MLPHINSKISFFFIAEWYPILFVRMYHTKQDETSYFNIAKLVHWFKADSCVHSLCFCRVPCGGKGS